MGTMTKKTLEILYSQALAEIERLKTVHHQSFFKLDREQLEVRCYSAEELIKGLKKEVKDFTGIKNEI